MSKRTARSSPTSRDPGSRSCLHANGLATNVAADQSGGVQKQLRPFESRLNLAKTTPTRTIALGNMGGKCFPARCLATNGRCFEATSTAGITIAAATVDTRTLVEPNPFIRVHSACDRRRKCHRVHHSPWRLRRDRVIQPLYRHGPRRPTICGHICPTANREPAPES